MLAVSLSCLGAGVSDLIDTCCCLQVCCYVLPCSRQLSRLLVLLHEALCIAETQRQPLDSQHRFEIVQVMIGFAPML